VATAPMLPLVLLVDDFEDSRMVYAEYLTHLGYRVIHAADGGDALAQARRLLPDVIVMDLELPVLDGLAATRALKGDARTRGIRIIALTGRVGDARSRQVREAGCDGLLTKPCRPGALLAALRAVLSGGTIPAF